MIIYASCVRVFSLFCGTISLYVYQFTSVICKQTLKLFYIYATQVFQEIRYNEAKNMLPIEGRFFLMKKEACEVSERKFAVADVALAWPFQRSLNEKVVKGTIVDGHTSLSVYRSKPLPPLVLLFSHFHVSTIYFTFHTTLKSHFAIALLGKVFNTHPSIK